MNQTCCSGSGGEATRRSPAAARAADGLALSASPTFAIMALLTTLGAATLRRCSVRRTHRH